MTHHFLLGEAAKILGRRPHQVAYSVTSGRVPEPERRIANKRLFSEGDIRRLARLFGVTPDWSAVVGRDADVGEPERPVGLALRPPFEVARSGESGHEVRDCDGEVFCWASDRARALILAGLLESAVQG